MKIIASDFDGTLKNDAGEITPDVIEKIKYFILPLNIYIAIVINNATYIKIIMKPSLL